MEFYKMNAEVLPRIHFLDEATISPPYVHRKRRAGEQILYYIKSGEMHLKEDGKELILLPGDVCILDGNRTHEGVDATKCNYYYVHFQCKDMKLVELDETDLELTKQFQRRCRNQELYEVSYGGYDEQILFLPKHWHIQNIADQVYLTELIQKAIREDFSVMENHKTMVSMDILKVFIVISRWYITNHNKSQGGSIPKSYLKIQQIQDYLNQYYYEDIASTTIEDLFACNFDYMNREFKQMIGQTIFSYLTTVRIEHAKRLMEQTNMHSRVIGQRVGYPDEYYFSKVFKRHVGMSPSMYMKMSGAKGRTMHACVQLSDLGTHKNMRN
ncbi:AraC family transcriptional regulator [Anaerosporobacter faecicola]|uniref:AraC family transcriptional regulator n=1 Tax=Anaerosporobacter faecicola TaxID=2718714 RepID=UPI00143906BF|nr:AraC family transcriptional regulator [Anaerosporobacter faecicola]